MAYADVDGPDSSMASTIASSMQQLSMSFGLACASLIAGWFLAGRSQSDHAALMGALHATFLAVGGVTVLSALLFSTLRADDGASVSGNRPLEAEDPVRQPP